MININGMTRGKISKRSCQVYERGDKVSVFPDLHVEYNDHAINKLTRSKPGNTPAKNKRPIDVSVAIP